MRVILILLLVVSGCVAQSDQITDNNIKDEDPFLLNADGDIYLSWFTQNSDADIVISKFDDSWSEPVIIQDQGDDFYPSLAYFDGKFHMTWFSIQSGVSNIFYSSSDDAVIWSEPVMVTYTEFVDWTPSITVNDKGIWIAWASNRRGSKDIFVIKSVDGINWNQTSRATLTDLEDDYPSILADGNLLMLVWTQYNKQDEFGTVDETAKIMYSASNDGIIWGSPTPVVDDYRHVDVFPRLFRTHNQSVFGMTWTSNQNDVFGDVFYLELPSGKPIKITRGGRDYSPSFARFEDGFMVAWVREEGSLEIFTKVID